MDFKKKLMKGLGMNSDEVLDQVLLFYLGEAWQGMSDINKCLKTIDRIDPDDPESWTCEWRKTAKRLERTVYEISLLFRIDGDILIVLNSITDTNLKGLADLPMARHFRILRTVSIPKD